MYKRQLFILAHLVMDKNFYTTYKKLFENQYNNYKILKIEQDRQLRHMIDFAYNNVPYYHKLFNNLNLFPEDIRTIEDLQKLPILTKKIIKENWEDFTPLNLNKIKYYENATGGSTGTPLKFRLSKFDRSLSGALLYRGWGYGGYKLGDKMVFLAGSSLDIGKKSYLEKSFHEISRNIRKLSSFDMSEKEMLEYVRIINSFKPKFIRGYASSIYFFVKWIDENNIKIHLPLAVFTTAEKLYPYMKEKIGAILNSEVYDTYGLNDGGLGAYECSEHCGLHIDTERSVFEVVDTDGNKLNKDEGRILATSLYNYAMPFIRYDTGDIGLISEDVCPCGRGHKLLKYVLGRSQEMLETPEGKHIHGEFFSHIFWDVDHVKEFQIIQEKLDTIIIKIVPEKNFDDNQLDAIKDIIRKRSEGWNIEYKFVDKIERTGAGKYKFIINNIGGELH